MFMVRRSLLLVLFLPSRWLLGRGVNFVSFMRPETIILENFLHNKRLNGALFGFPTRSMLGPRCLQGKVCISNPDCAGAGCPAGRVRTPNSSAHGASSSCRFFASWLWSGWRLGKGVIPSRERCMLGRGVNLESLSARNPKGAHARPRTTKTPPRRRHR